MNSTNSTFNGLVRGPGNDGRGGGCEPSNSLPRFAHVFDPSRNVFVSSLDADGTYNVTAWARCCADNRVSLADGCYPYCDIPAVVLKGRNKAEITDDMNGCVNKTGIFATFLASGAGAPAPAPAGMSVMLMAGMVVMSKLL